MLFRSFGQRKAVLDTIQRFISARIDDPKLKAPIDDFFANYLSAKPISEGMLWDDKAGICIDVLTEKNRVVYYLLLLSHPHISPQ